MELSPPAPAQELEEQSGHSAETGTLEPADEDNVHSSDCAWTLCVDLPRAEGPSPSL